MVRSRFSVRVNKKTGKTTITPSEHTEQASFIEWCRLQALTGKYPNIGRIFAIPNGGHRYAAVAGKLKAEGVQSGVPDLFLPVPLGRYSGLFIEMKAAAGGSISLAQNDWINYLNDVGYCAVVARGFDQARIHLEWYYGGQS